MPVSSTRLAGWRGRLLAMLLAGLALGSVQAAGPAGAGLPAQALPATLAAELRAEDVAVIEPHNQRRIVYRGVALPAALDRVLGPQWREAEAIEFVCADGYRASIEVAQLLAHRAWLAHARADGSAFRLDNRLQGEEVALGPFYLVWDTLNDEVMRERGASQWPYQVVAVAPVSLAARFGRAMPPPDATPEARRGFEIARQLCLHCHTMNGDGGDKAMELNTAALAGRYADEAWLRAWLVAPERLRPGTTMPALEVAVGERQDSLRALQAWLQTMSAAPERAQVLPVR